MKVKFHFALHKIRKFAAVVNTLSFNDINASGETAAGAGAAAAPDFFKNLHALPAACPVSALRCGLLLTGP